VFGWGAAVICGEVAMMSWGFNNTVHGTNWAMRSNGGFWVLFFGISAVFVLLFMGLYALASSRESRVLRALLPVHGRWARYWVVTLLWLFGLMAIASVVLMPIA
jgi:hypothetical protein